MFPDYGIEQALPLNQGVAIDFTPLKAGDVAFACGMGMLKGVLMVKEPWDALAMAEQIRDVRLARATLPESLPTPTSTSSKASSTAWS